MTVSGRRQPRLGSAIGWCSTHGKLLYGSRQEARAAQRTMHAAGKGMRPYPCDHVDSMWHLGHIPIAVRRGQAVSADIYPKEQTD